MKLMMEMTKKSTNYKVIILAQSWLATVGSLYFGWFGDPVENFQTGDMFNTLLGYSPCEMCWFARILMYPILLMISISFLNNDRKVVDYILALSGIGTVLEAYQYYIQMMNHANIVKTTICGTDGINCAATDVIYGEFVTIPFLCLVAFIVIFITSWVWKRSQRNK